MAMVDMRNLMQHAYDNRYAVGAFEIANLDFLQAIVEAAESVRSPVILNIVEPHISESELDLLTAATLRAAERASVPVAIHMDHCRSLDVIEASMRLGCNSVKFDSACESFPVNVQRSKEVVELAHAWGIPVEGEVGFVAGLGHGDEESNSDSPVYTHVDEARAYIEKTGVDFLAVSIGTVHGRVKGKAKLDYTRLAKIQEKVAIPCVIHGGTGLSEHQYRKLIDYGVAKINFFTALAETNAKQLEVNLKNKSMSHHEVFSIVRNKITEEVKQRIHELNSAGRAAEVLMQCRAWKIAKSVILFNPENANENSVEQMLSQGQQELMQIPGVLNVEVAEIVVTKGKHDHCWVVRAVNEEVLKRCRSHPIYEKYLKLTF